MSIYLVGGLNPSENICQLGLFFPIYGKIKHVPSKPPTIYIIICIAYIISQHNNNNNNNNI